MAEHQAANYGQGVMPYAAFVEFARPAFHREASPADLDAVLKRNSVLVHGKAYIYVRPAGIDGANNVVRVKMETKLLITAGTCNLFKTWSKVKHSSGPQPTIRGDDVAGGLAEEEFELVSNLTTVGSPTGGDDEDDGERSAAPRGIEEEHEDETALARSFSDAMLGLLHGFGGLPPEFAADPAHAERGTPNVRGCTR